MRMDILLEVKARFFANDLFIEERQLSMSLTDIVQEHAAYPTHSRCKGHSIFPRLTLFEYTTVRETYCERCKNILYWPLEVKNHGLAFWIGEIRILTSGLRGEDKV